MNEESAKISRRKALKLGLAGVAAATSPGLTEEQRSLERPNILLLMADQFRGDCLSAEGHPAVRTPHLDRIAAEGVRFRQAYSSTPSCTPARAGLLTGLGPWRHGMLGYGRVGEQYPTEMPQVLRDAGYYTMGIGKMHYHPQRNPHGFHQVLLDESGRVESPDYRSDYRSWFASEAPHLDPDATGIGWNDYPSRAYVLPERLHPTSWTGQTAVRFVENYERPEPFFLKVSYARPHSPYDPPERLMQQYAGAEIPPAVVGAWAERYAPLSSQRPDLWHGDLGPEQVRSSRQGYYGSVTFIDEQIGRILAALEKRGWLEHTLILFTADHGDMTGDHHLWRKTYAYDASARIPMLMRWPEGLGPAPRGQVLTSPVELRDVLPTCMDAAAIPGGEALDGRSMLDLVRNNSADWREYIDLEHHICYSPTNNWSALTDGHEKYIYHAHDGEEQLFDLDRDPHELKDLASDPAQQSRVRRWRSRLIEHLAERREPFVVNGELGRRPQGRLYSPHYPGCSCHPPHTSS